MPDSIEKEPVTIEATASGFCRLVVEKTGEDSLRVRSNEIAGQVGEVLPRISEVWDEEVGVNGGIKNLVDFERILEAATTKLGKDFSGVDLNRTKFALIAMISLVENGYGRLEHPGQLKIEETIGSTFKEVLALDLVLQQRLSENQNAGETVDFGLVELAVVGGPDAVKKFENFVSEKEPEALENAAERLADGLAATGSYEFIMNSFYKKVAKELLTYVKADGAGEWYAYLGRQQATIGDLVCEDHNYGILSDSHVMIVVKNYESISFESAKQLEQEEVVTSTTSDEQDRYGKVVEGARVVAKQLGEERERLDKEIEERLQRLAQVSKAEESMKKLEEEALNAGANFDFELQRYEAGVRVFQKMEIPDAKSLADLDLAAERIESAQVERFLQFPDDVIARLYEIEIASVILLRGGLSAILRLRQELGQSAVDDALNKIIGEFKETVGAAGMQEGRRLLENMRRQVQMTEPDFPEISAKKIKEANLLLRMNY